MNIHQEIRLVRRPPIQPASLASSIKPSSLAACSDANARASSMPPSRLMPPKKPERCVALPCAVNAADSCCQQFGIQPWGPTSYARSFKRNPDLSMSAKLPPLTHLHEVQTTMRCIDRQSPRPNTPKEHSAKYSRKLQASMCHA